MDALLLAGPVAAGSAVGFLTAGTARSRYAVDAPSWGPPPWAFGVVWPVLYLLMGVASWLVYRQRGAAGAARLALTLYAAQLALNMAWSAVYFTFRQQHAALALLLILDALVVATVVAFARVSPLAAWLMAPYLAWSLFATALLGSIVVQ